RDRRAHLTVHERHLRGGAEVPQAQAAHVRDLGHGRVLRAVDLDRQIARLADAHLRRVERGAHGDVRGGECREKQCDREQPADHQSSAGSATPAPWSFFTTSSGRTSWSRCASSRAAASSFDIPPSFFSPAGAAAPCCCCCSCCCCCWSSGCWFCCSRWWSCLAWS